MKTQDKPRPLAGALVGVVLAAPLISLGYFGWKSFGIPFAPFSLFDWLVRVLPGRLMTAGIEIMVRIIRTLNLGQTSAAAKLGEQATAIALVLLEAAIAGLVVFAVAGHNARLARGLGLSLGGLFAVAALAATATQPSGIGLLAVLWTGILGLAWGGLLGWAFRRMQQDVLPLDADGAERVSAQPVDRRRFLLRVGGVSALITVVGAVVGRRLGTGSEIPQGKRWSELHPLPNADAVVQPAPGTRPEFTRLEDHYRIDINTRAPVVDSATWRLRIGGLVERPLTLTLDELRRYEPMHQFITLSCISNPVGGDLIGTTRWTGVSLQRLVPDWGLRPNASHLRIRSVDGFHENIALDTIRRDDRVMLTYAWDGVPLMVKHGFPLRIYIPDRYGMKQPKWIESIEAIDHWTAGYWVERGWDREARMKATSVVDTVAVNERIVDAQGNLSIPVGGIAHAGARGISRVQLQVDAGEWHDARLRTPVSDTTWVVWRYNLPFQAGQHTLTVRCFDGHGAAQIVEPSSPHPSGATGLDSKTATL